MLRASRLVVVPVVVALAAALVACGPGGGGDDEPTSAPTSDAPSPSGSTPAADDDPEGPAPVTAPPCTRADVSNAYLAVDNTAGQAHALLLVRNESSAACSLSGYPTLYFGYPGIAVPMGSAANHDPADPGTPLDLQPGEEAAARITITTAGNLEGCEPLEADAMQWAPPGVEFDVETTAQHVDISTTLACSAEVGQLRVGGFSAT